MKTNFLRRRAIVLYIFILALFVSNASAFGPRPLPNPVLVFNGQELFSREGKQFIRYNYFVFNTEDFPSELFAPSPELPPCGTNKNASRTWIDMYEQNGKRLYGFCALGKPQDLNGIFFILEADVIPPSWIYIEMDDRKTNTKYKSNLAETTL